MKTHRLSLIVLLCFAAAAACSAKGDASTADRDWQAFEAVDKAEPSKPYKEMSRLELSQHLEERAVRRRELGLAFIEKHPDDPRRWSVIHRFFPTSPRFVKEWGPLNADGVPDHPVVDDMAAAAWKAKVAELKAAMAQATDLPRDVVKSLAVRDEAEAQRKAFYSKWQGGKEMAVDFPMNDLSGRELSLADYRGKIVVLDFWAPWCGPCKAAMPHTQEVAAKYKTQGVVVIASCTNDTRESFEKWVETNQANYPDIVWAFDPAAKSDERASKKHYEVLGIPSQFVIGRDGRVVDVVLGYFKGEVLLDGALAKAGIEVDAATLAQAEAQRKKRSLY